MAHKFAFITFTACAALAAAMLQGCAGEPTPEQQARQSARACAPSTTGTHVASKNPDCTPQAYGISHDELERSGRGSLGAAVNATMH